jgi:hypothetical protein
MGEIVSINSKREEQYEQQVFELCSNAIDNIAEMIIERDLKPEDFKSFEDDMNILYNMMAGVIFRSHNKPHFLDKVMDILKEKIVYEV